MFRLSRKTIFAVEAVLDIAYNSRASLVQSGEITKNPIRDYEKESYIHYHEFIDSCLGKGDCSAPFSYSARLTETILLGVIAGRFPNKTLHWDNTTAKFLEKEANNLAGCGSGATQTAEMPSSDFSVCIELQWVQ